MKCRELRHWLLTERTPADLPAPLRQHLRRCRRCQRWQRRLQRLDESVSALVPAANPGLEAFLAALPTLPAPAEGERARPPALAGRVRGRGLLVAAVLLLASAAGALVLVQESDAPPEATPAAVAPGADGRLVARFVERDLRLADNLAAREQLGVFMEMADDLRHAAVGASRSADSADLPLFTALYEQVLGRLAARSRTLPGAERPASERALLAWLHGTQADLEAAARQGQGSLTALAAATRQATLAVAHAPGDAPPERAVRVPSSADYRLTLLTALVVNGLRLADEGDPLRRADCCSDVADQLLQALVMASVQGEPAEVPALARHLSEFIERGISVNLARVPANEPRVAELRQVMRRAAQTLEAIDRTLVQSPTMPPGKLDPAALQQMKQLEGALKDVEKSLKRVQHAFKDEPDKGKGKDKDKKDKKAKQRGSVDLPSPALVLAAPPRPWLTAAPHTVARLAAHEFASERPCAGLDRHAARCG